ELTAARSRARERELVALRRRQAQLARTGAPSQSWTYLEIARVLAPQEPVLIVDLLDLASELGRYDDVPELVRAWQAMESEQGRAAMLSWWGAEAHLDPARR